MKGFLQLLRAGISVLGGLVLCRVGESADFSLSVAIIGGTKVVSWPSNFIGSELQWTTDLNSPWTPQPSTVTTNQITVSQESAMRFFRLYAPSLPTFGLVARYDLNNNVFDPVGGHNGTNHGALPTSNRFTNGFSAMAFNGTNAYIEIPDNDIFSISTTGEFSISVWMRPGATTFPNSEGGPSQTDYVYWMGKGQNYGTNNGDQEWACRMYNYYNSEARTNRTSFYVFNPEGHCGNGSYVQDPIALQVWLHFVATADISKNSIKWYKNGILRDVDDLSVVTNPILPKNGPAPVRLGTMNFDSYWIGSIDNLLFYNRVLSPFEVNQLYHDPTP